jgi:hypothetical protein
MKRLVATLSAAALLSFGATSASAAPTGASSPTSSGATALSSARPAAQPSLGYVEAGHAMAYQLLLRGLPVAKRLPDVKCATWVLVRSSSTKLHGRFYADDCKGNGFVVGVAARKDGATVTGWAGPLCRTSGPTKRAKGKIAPGCSLGSFPW